MPRVGSKPGMLRRQPRPLVTPCLARRWRTALEGLEGVAPAWEALFVMFAAAIKGVKAEAEAPRRGGFDKSRLGGFDKSRLGVRSKGAAAATLSQTRPKGVAKRPRPATANKHAFQVPLL